jgi:DNA-binding CsgD family transcriptional regulator
MHNLIPSTYQELFDAAEHYYSFPKPQTQELLQNMGYRASSLNAQAPIFYAGDYTRGVYLHLDPSCEILLGFTKEFLANQGHEFYNSLIHPNDYMIFNQKIFPETINFYRKLDPSERLNYSCSYNYRVRVKSNKYLTVLQRGTYYLHPETGIPLANVGFIIDITHFKEDTKMIHTIEKIDRNFSVLSAEPVYKAIYYPQKENTGLTKRENEILQMIVDGLSSKKISEKLFISIHTINNHRKNILQKTGCTNTSELLSYALKNGLA